MKWPLAAPTVRPQIERGAEFVSLKGEVELKDQSKALKAPWISKKTCRLVDRRVMLPRAGRASMREVCKARRDFQRTNSGR